MAWALAGTECISYGVLYYAFAAFLLPMQRSLGYSQTTLAGAFSPSVLVTGAGAVPAGAWLDRHGARYLMTAGSLLAAGSVLLWARADSVAALYLAFAGIGLASRLGWRHALLVLAAVQATTAVPHALLLRRRPADHGWQRDGIRPVPSPPDKPAPANGAETRPDPATMRPLADVLRSRPVLLLTGGTVLGSAAIAAVAVYLLAYLRQDGHALAFAASAAGALGIVQVAGRVVLTAAARRMPTAVATALLLAAQVAAVAALLLLSGLVGVVIFVACSGTPDHHRRSDRPDRGRGAADGNRQLHARVHSHRCLLPRRGPAVPGRRPRPPPGSTPDIKACADT